MKLSFRFIVNLLVLTLISKMLLAQQGVVATGGEGNSAGGSVSFSVGQVDFTGFSSASGSVHPGLQHAFTVPDFLGLQNIVVGSGDDVCFNAQQTVTLAGSGTTFIVQTGGSAEVIAGQSIIMYDGFKVEHDGSFHGHITQTNNFCTKSGSMLEVIHDEFAIQPDFDLKIRGIFFNAFPNPTTGKLSIEVFDSEKSERVLIEVFNIQGNLIKTVQFMGKGIYQMDISAQQSGIYIIRAIKDDSIVTRKIIKL